MTRRPGRGGPRFARGLGWILLAGLALHVAYWAAQPGSDPAWNRPVLDGAYYWDWARSLAQGAGGPGGAYYLAPLYPHFLAALFLAGLGARGVFLAQHLLVVLSAGLLAVVTRRRAGPAAGLAAAVLYLTSHSLEYFASRPVGETLALSLAAASLWAVDRRSGGPLAGGALAGLASLARPNLLLLPALWAAGEASRRRWARAGWIAAGAALVVLPVTARNLAVSGHWVTITSNGGITAWHGNGPGAQGSYSPQPGLTGELATQREGARRLAEIRSGRTLDAVEADRWWGRQALGVRLSRPGESALLAGRRLLLTLGPWEYGLAYHPALDSNPWRLTWRTGAAEVPLVPFTLLAALAVAGLVAAGPGPSGGRTVWTAVAVAALAPVAFYVSSRYRLPLAAFLVVPGGAGFAALAGLVRPAPKTVRRAAGAGAALACIVAPLLLPTERLRRSDLADGLRNRSASYRHAGDLAAAERDAREAVRVYPASSLSWSNLGVTLERSGRVDEAEEAYRRALDVPFPQPEAASNLATVLGRRGRFDEAVPILRSALDRWPVEARLWEGLVVSLVGAGRIEAAREAAREAERRGVALRPGMLEDLAALPGPGAAPP